MKKPNNLQYSCTRYSHTAETSLKLAMTRFIYHMLTTFTRCGSRKYLKCYFDGKGKQKSMKNEEKEVEWRKKEV